MSHVPHVSHVGKGTPRLALTRSAIARAIAQSATVEPPSPLRFALTTTVPVLAASAFESFLWPSAGRWSIFLPAVFLCAWFGGFESGVAATFASAAIMWWFFAPPEHVLLKPLGVDYAVALLFVLTGLLISALLRGLRRSYVELGLKHRLLQGILDYSPSAIMIKDLNSRYILINQAFAKLTGVKLETALEHTDLDIFARPLAEYVLAREKQVRDTQMPLVFEEKLNQGPQRFVLVTEFPILDESERPFAIGVIETDISDRKRDEEALRNAMDELRAAQHVAHVGSWRWDFRTNQATWSEELYRIFGIDPHQSPTPLVNPGLKLLTADSILRLTSAIEKIRTDGEPYEIDVEFTRPDGARRWCSARAEAMRDPSGQIIGINATAADITHIKELERLREEWTSMIAHDLRQPIGVISMASELMPDLRGDGSEKEQDVIRRIQSAAQALDRMVSDLMDMSLLEGRRLKLERRLVDPRALVRGVVGQLEHLTGDHVDIVDTGPLPSVLVDPVRMQQVLGNLLANAAKYREPRTGIEVRLARTDGEVRIAVTNRGQGIAPDELPRLFDRFMRSKTTRGSGVTGLGLGLYISKGIVETHGGRLSVDSIPGKTTTFQIALPVATASREAA